MLPESKGYAREITDSGDNGSRTTDYKARYEAEVRKNQELEAQIKALKDKLNQINSISKV